MKNVQTAASVIEESLFLVRDITKDRWHESVMYFMRAIRDFELFHGSATQVWRPVSDIHTVRIPEDCLEIVGVGLSLNGEVFTFTKNERMSMPSAPIYNKLITARNEEAALIISPQSGSAAKSINEAGYFDVDLKNNRIVLKQAFLQYYTQAQQSEVLVKYIGSNITDVNTSYIPAKAVNMITNNIAYNLTLSNEKSTPFMIQTRRAEYEKAAILYDALKLPSADELLDAIYSTASLSLRR